MKHGLCRHLGVHLICKNTEIHWGGSCLYAETVYTQLPPQCISYQPFLDLIFGFATCARVAKLQMGSAADGLPPQGKKFCIQATMLAPSLHQPRHQLTKQESAAVVIQPLLPPGLGSGGHKPVAL